MKSDFPFQAPVVIETTAEEVPPSRAPSPPPTPAKSENPEPAQRRADVIPFASTLRHIAPDAPIWREIA